MTEKMIFPVAGSWVPGENFKKVTAFLELIEQTMHVKDRYMVQTIDDRPYLERIVLDRKSEHGAGTYLHIIWESDLDRDPHDHPFDFSSQIIWGGYEEERFRRRCGPCNRSTELDVVSCPKCGATLHASDEAEFKKRFTAGMHNQLQAHQLHRLTLLQKPTITLVHRGPRIRDWGFMTKGGWQVSREWIAKNKPNASTEIE